MDIFDLYPDTGVTIHITSPRYETNLVTRKSLGVWTKGRKKQILIFEKRESYISDLEWRLI